MIAMHREDTMKAILENKMAYNKLVDDRIKGLVDTRTFIREEERLNYYGVELRHSIGISTVGDGGARCDGCGKFFVVQNTNIDGLIDCSRHKGLSAVAI